MKKVIFIILLSVCSLSLLSQSSLTLKGAVNDANNGEPIPYANIMMLNPDDSTFILGTVADSLGRFEMEGRTGIRYLLKASSMGYRSFFHAVVFSKEGLKDPLVLRLDPATESLEELVVTADRALVTSSADKLEYNVSEMASSGGATILDVMKNIPGVTVNADGSIFLRGSDKVNVLIDGKPSALLGAGRYANIRQIPATAIEKVEVITNPSAKYDPDGMAGIINIVYKEEKRQGWNGEASFTYGLNDIFLPSLSLNYRSKKVNFFGQFDGTWKEFINHDRDLTRTSLSDQSSLKQKYYTSEPVDAQIYRGGLDVYLGRTTLTGYVQYEDEYEENIGYIDYRYYSPAGLFEEGRRRELVEKEYNDVYDYAFLLKHEFKKPGQELEAGAIYSSAHEQEVYAFSEYPMNENGDQADEVDLSQKTDLDETNTSYNIYADYVHPLRNGQVEAGYKSIFREIALDFLGYNVQSGMDILIPGWNYLFNYTEQVHAVYGSMRKTWGKFNIEAGMRMEQVFTRSTEDSTGYSFNNDYFLAYPNLKIGRTLKGNNEILLAYSGRVNRPDFEQLNLIPKFVDPLNLEIGNPELDPEYVHNFELTWKKGFKVIQPGLSVFYKHILHPIYTIASVDSSGIARYVPQNLDRGNHTGAELLFALHPADWLDINGSLTWYRQTIAASETFGTGKKEGQSWLAKVSVSGNIPWQLQYQVDGWYNAPQVTPQGKLFAQSSVDLSLSRKMLDDRLKVFLRVTDLFNMLNIEEEYTVGEEHIRSVDRYETRFFYAGISFRI